MKVLLVEFFVKAKKFVKENPGALPILGFQMLLVACAVLLALGLGGVAEGLAVIAYFLLVVGVLVQLVSFWRDSRSE